LVLEDGPFAVAPDGACLGVPVHSNEGPVFLGTKEGEEGTVRDCKLRIIRP
jgi:hypothetical protein